MFKFIIVFILGAITSLFLYACILVGKNSDNFTNIIETEKLNERRNSN